MTCECFRCGTGFTEPVPRVFCPPCRPLAAGEAAKAHESALAGVAAEYGLMPGDRVRLRTAGDRAFEAAVMAGLAEL